MESLVNHIANNDNKTNIFYFYYTHYDKNIINYTKFIFKCETYEEFINKYDYIFDGKEFKEYYDNL